MRIINIIISTIQIIILLFLVSCSENVVTPSVDSTDTTHVIQTHDEIPTTTPAEPPIPTEITQTPTSIATDEVGYILTINGQLVNSQVMTVDEALIVLSIPPDKNDTFPPNSVITVKVTPIFGWEINHWVGTDSDSSISTISNVTMNSNKSVQIYFTKLTYTLTIQAPIPSEGGIIIPSPGSYKKEIWEEVTLEAAPNFGWQVSGWKGTDDDSSIVKNNKVTINSDKSVEVQFEESVPKTVFTYSGTGKMYTPVFQVNSPPWLLRFMVDWDGYFEVKLRNGIDETVISRDVYKDQVYETYIHDFTGSGYFDITEAPPFFGHWKLWVIENPAMITPEYGTIFTYSGIGPMITPPFRVSESSWKLKYVTKWDGIFTIQIITDNISSIMHLTAYEGDVYEFPIAGHTGLTYFSIQEAPPDGQWKIWVFGIQ